MPILEHKSHLMPAFNGVFLVSDDGLKVYRDGKLKPQYTNSRGYRFINARVHGKQKNILVHRLVADAFIPNPDGLPLVNHKDLDKTNNHVSNLEWITHMDNTRHYFETSPDSTEKWKAATEKRKAGYAKGDYGAHFSCRLLTAEAEQLKKILVQEKITFVEFVRRAIKSHQEPSK